jgi:replicative DNA helicase
VSNYVEESIEIGMVGQRRVDAEKYLIGAALSGCRDLDDLLDAVTPDDFTSDVAAEIWRSVAIVHRAGVTPDLVAIRDDLVARKVARDESWMFSAAHEVPILSNGTEYARQVVLAAGLRNLQRAAISVYQLASGSGDLEEMREESRAIIDAATASKTTTRARMVADLMPDVVDVAENGTAEALSTGWPDVDRLIGGIAPGRLIVIGARPGVGKSLAGTNLALHVAHHHGHLVHIASLEMPEREVGQRLLAAHASVGLTGITTGKVPEDEWQRIARKYAEIEALPISVDDAPQQTVTHIRAAARNLQRKRDDLALIVVDYLQLVKPGDSVRRGANRAEEVADISRGLKLLARETGACVVAMAQLNREAAKGDGKPRLTDLRESGSIEADADQVILMHQPDDEIPELELLIDKNRHGPRGATHLQVAGHYAQLRNPYRH